MLPDKREFNELISPILKEIAKALIDSHRMLKTPCANRNGRPR